MEKYRSYQNGMNEGGDGYNPYSPKLEAEPVTWMTYLDRRDSLQQKLTYISIDDPRYKQIEDKLAIAETELAEQIKIRDQGRQ